MRELLLTFALWLVRKTATFRLHGPRPYAEQEKLTPLTVLEISTALSKLERRKYHYTLCQEWGHGMTTTYAITVDDSAYRVIMHTCDTNGEMK